MGISTRFGNWKIDCEQTRFGSICIYDECRMDILYRNEKKIILTVVYETK